jgi:hypothetical protein
MISNSNQSSGSIELSYVQVTRICKLLENAVFEKHDSDDMKTYNLFMDFLYKLWCIMDSESGTRLEAEYDRKQSFYDEYDRKRGEL